MRKAFFVLLAFISAGIASSQMLKWTGSDAKALDLFRIGVQAYNRGYFNDAILGFEKALSAEPEDPLILAWAAQSYFRSGLEDTSLRQWQSILDSGMSSPLFTSKIEFVKNRRDIAGWAGSPERFIDTGEIRGQTAKNSFFLRPSCVLPERDGSVWISAYGSNELILFDLNGVVKNRLKGPVNGFDRPFSVVRGGGGGFFVSETNGNRISVLNKDGSYVKSFGKKGRGNGEFVGPQYLAYDGKNYLYVCDYGNRRIQKFDSEGNFILSFGEKAQGFSGFSSPTGIAIAGNTLYISDSYQKAIYQFDTDGNFMDSLGAEDLHRPEGLSWYGPDILLITDTDRLLTLDLRSREFFSLYSSLTKNSRYISSSRTANGDILLVDFDASQLLIASPASSLYSGYFVQIAKTNADNFPVVEIEINIQDKTGRPVVGLERRNFYLTETVSKTEKREENGKATEYRIDSVQSIDDFELVAAGNEDSSFDIAVMIEESSATKGRGKDLRNAIQEILAAIGGRGSLKIIHTGLTPTIDSADDLSTLSKSVSSAEYSRDWKFDTGLRLAASSLVGGRPKKAVIFVGSGQVDTAGYARYPLSVLASFLTNNGIQFIAVTIENSAPDEALSYLVDQTRGYQAYLYRAEGLKSIIETVPDSLNGTYRIKFTSKSDPGFGRTYIPFAVETYLMKKSGRDESGFFSPFK